jgi:membrane protein implicated in regulation of membrane protease activity
MLWFVLFAVTVFSRYFWREYSVQKREHEAPTARHRSGERFIGQVLTMETGIRGGSATVQLGGRKWRVRGPELDPGSRVRITGVDGTVLLVDRLPS